MASLELMGLEVAIPSELQTKAFLVALFNNNIPVQTLLKRHNFLKDELTVTLNDLMQISSDTEVISSISDIIETHHSFYTPANIALIEHCWTLQSDLWDTLNRINEAEQLKKDKERFFDKLGKNSQFAFLLFALDATIILPCLILSSGFPPFIFLGCTIAMIGVIYLAMDLVSAAYQQYQAKKTYEALFTKSVSADVTDPTQKYSFFQQKKDQLITEIASLKLPHEEEEPSPHQVV